MNQNPKNDFSQQSACIGFPRKLSCPATPAGWHKTTLPGSRLLVGWTIVFVGWLACGYAPVAVAQFPEGGESRIWKDTTGKFAVDAFLLAVDGEKAALRKKSGEKIEVPLARLSEADRAYIAKTRQAVSVADGKPEPDEKLIDLAIEKFRDKKIFVLPLYGKKADGIVLLQNNGHKIDWNASVSIQLGDTIGWCNACSFSLVGSNEDAPDPDSKFSSSVLVNVGPLPVRVEELVIHKGEYVVWKAAKIKMGDDKLLATPPLQPRPAGGGREDGP